MGIVEEAQRIAEVMKRWGYEFKQGLGIIGRNTGVGQGGPECRRMRCLRDAAVDRDAQTFLFQADLALLQHFSDVAVEQLRDTLFNYGFQYWVLAGLWV